MLEKVLYFDEMLTPRVIQIVYWVTTALIILGGLRTIVSGITSSYGGGFQVFMGLLTITLGPVANRIWCEILIVIFKIYESLQRISKE